MGLYHLEALEFHKVLEILGEFAHSSLGRKYIYSITPSTDIDKINELFDQVREALLFMDTEGDISLDELEDISDLLGVAKLEGAVLDVDKILRVKRQLLIARSIRLRLESDRYPSLSKMVRELSLLKGLCKEIDEAISSSGEIKDEATSELAKIRSAIKSVRGEITSRLRRMVSDPALVASLSDRSLHLRGDRFTIAVRAERVSRINGIVVDTSSTGRTLFVEPSGVVPLNNRLVSLREAEKREVEKILKALTRHVGRHAGALLCNQRILAIVDATFAKARFAKAFRATIPGVGYERKLSIVKGRHPILCRLKGDDVVPLDVSLDDRVRTLVITGPNTGGKTVALKTVGLLTLMALSGIPVTAGADSYFFVFEKVLADIGDEQDIESSLSTFSSHMERIKKMVETADSRTLSLVDELGTGTDPEEGSALAVAIAEYLHSRGGFNIITTHHGDLKLLAYSTPGMENASVEFDIESLRPTYKLRIGVPGESKAFLIAKRLGLREDIVHRAEKVKGTKGEGRSEVVSWIMKSRIEAERLLEEARHLKEKAERHLERARSEAERIREEAFKEAMKIVEEAKRKVSQARREGDYKIVKVAREIARDVVKRREERIKPQLEVGSIVEVPAFKIKGKVVSVKGSAVEVYTGKIKMRVPLASVVPTGEKDEVKSSDLTKDVSLYVERSRESFYPELKLLGMRVDEAIPELERFINDGHLLGFKSLRVVHGKGEGILKRAVHEHLRDHPLVVSFRLADEREGGSGVTIVELE